MDFTESKKRKRGSSDLVLGVRCLDHLILRSVTCFSSRIGAFLNFGDDYIPGKTSDFWIHLNDAAGIASIFMESKSPKIKKHHREVVKAATEVFVQAMSHSGTGISNAVSAPLQMISIVDENEKEMTISCNEDWVDEIKEFIAKDSLTRVGKDGIKNITSMFF